MSLAFFYDSMDFEKMCNWTDDQFEKSDFANILFSIQENEISLFRTDPELRLKVIRISLRILDFISYAIDVENWNVIRVKSIFRKENGVVVGLYSKHNYVQLEMMMIFLNIIEMQILSSCVFLAICLSIQLDPVLRDRVSGVLERWKGTQKYIKTPELSGLSYTGNSCYQDSTLIALFGVPNRVIEKAILEKVPKPEYEGIQNELRRITKSMRGSRDVKTCSNLRKLLISREFRGTEAQDAGEFLLHLFDLFQVETIVYQLTTYVTNSIDSVIESPINLLEIQKRLYSSTPIVSIPALSVKDRDDFKLEEFISTTEDAVFDENNLYFFSETGESFQRRIEKTVIKSASYIIFNVQRMYMEDMVTKSAVTISETINNLTLSAIVVHRNMHYTCYIKANNIWNYYDDMAESLKKIGSFEKMLTSHPNPSTNGVLFFYN